MTPRTLTYLLAAVAVVGFVGWMVVAPRDGETVNIDLASLTVPDLSEQNVILDR